MKVIVEFDVGEDSDTLKRLIIEIETLKGRLRLYGLKISMTGELNLCADQYVKSEKAEQK